MSATFWHYIIAGILVLAAVLIFLNRRGIRARFGRNMPSALAARKGPWPPPPEPWPAAPEPPAASKRPSMPLPIPPPPPETTPPAPIIPPAPKREPTAEEDRAQLVESIAWGLLQRHAPDLSPAEAFEKAEAWQRIMENREAIRAGIHDFPPGAEIVAGEPVAVGEDGKVRPIEKREPKL